MDPGMAREPLAWIVALVLLALCWPLAQWLRHEKLHPLAAWLLFTSILVLVSAAVFLILLWGARLLLSPAALAGPGAAAAIVVLSLLPGLAAARWIVRRPQQRRMPR
jgi:type VI protein secretion system component VasK